MKLCYLFVLVVLFSLGNNSNNYFGRVVYGGNKKHLEYEDGLKNYHEIELPGGVIGPESIAFDCNGGGPYVGVSDGRVLKWQNSKLGWTPFAFPSPNRDRKECDGSKDPDMEPKCGRPLGIKFNPKSCELYIADAYYGLLVVGPRGGVARRLAVSVEGVPFCYLNALDIDTNSGVVYFTDSSIHYQRRKYLMGIMSGDKTGRLMKYDPRSKTVTLMSKGLAMPNGVALSMDSSFILVAESGALQILEFPLTDTPNNNITTHNYYYGTPQVFSQLERFPDNIKRNERGEFWVALNSARGKLVAPMRDDVRNESTIQWFAKDPVGVKFNKNGEVMKVLDGDNGAALNSVSEVEERNGILWVGSSVQPYLAFINTNNNNSRKACRFTRVALYVDRSLMDNKQDKKYWEWNCRVGVESTTQP